MRYSRVRLRCATVRCGALRVPRFALLLCAVRLALAHGATQASGISAGSMQIRGLIPFTSSPAFVQPAAWPIIIIIHSQHCAIVPILSTLCSTVVFTLILSSRIQNPALAFPFSNSRYPLPATRCPWSVSHLSRFAFPFSWFRLLNFFGANPTLMGFALWIPVLFYCSPAALFMLFCFFKIIIVLGSDFAFYSESLGK